jgi:addiction module RelE/StbE family toxin
MRTLFLHKSAEKSLRKAPQKIKKRFIELSEYLINDNIKECRFEIVWMKGKYKIYKEVKIDKDYRIIFKIEDNLVFIRYAGSHNYLHTG